MVERAASTCACDIHTVHACTEREHREGEPQYLYTRSTTLFTVAARRGRPGGVPTTCPHPRCEILICDCELLKMSIEVR